MTITLPGFKPPATPRPPMPPGSPEKADIPPAPEEFIIEYTCLQVK